MQISHFVVVVVNVVHLDILLSRTNHIGPTDGFYKLNIVKSCIPKFYFNDNFLFAMEKFCYCKSHYVSGPFIFSQSVAGSEG